ncbi:hypothetical protein SPI_06696 [Niveomyces insectorum RCEF 264]|uniref:Uncharacterized protein n=1 Tax=Niveomyces insectorum RCEF 264 TaxID=1081102 RepID=A0A167RI58_9HYPO|nr:hypothetical protein SPI_06696 [Niveomyces insectorum RCEF 264]
MAREKKTRDNPPRNDQWEDQIDGFRRNRRLLRVSNIAPEATRTAFETAVRAQLRSTFGAVAVLWPPPPPSLEEASSASPSSCHMGWAMLGFSQRHHVQSAQADLAD